jgi:hypothetical protein
MNIQIELPSAAACGAAALATAKTPTTHKIAVVVISPRSSALTDPMRALRAGAGVPFDLVISPPDGS